MLRRASLVPVLALIAVLAVIATTAGCGSSGATPSSLPAATATRVEAPPITPEARSARAAHPLVPRSAVPAAAAGPVVVEPRIAWDPIPFDARRKAEMVAYVRRHYGSFMNPTYRLSDPHVIVIHYTETPIFRRPTTRSPRTIPTPSCTSCRTRAPTS